MYVEISLDSEKFKQKPSPDRQYKDYTNRKGKILTEPMVLGSRVGKTVKKIPLEAFAKAICSGQTWSPFIFNKCPITGKVRRRIELFNRCSTLALDFDDGTSYEEILDICSKNKLNPNIIHESFSSTSSLRKYRVIFVLDKQYKINRKVRLMILTLLEIFPSADKSAKDLARLMYGTNKKPLLVDSTATNSISIDPAVEERMEEKNLLYDGNDNKHNVPIVGSYEQFKRDFPKLSINQQGYIKKALNKAMLEIRLLDNTSKTSRYEVVFTNSERLTGIKGLYGEVILGYLLHSINNNPYFNDWSYDPTEVITSAIKWKANTPNIKKGDLFDINEYIHDIKEEK